MYFYKFYNKNNYFQKLLNAIASGIKDIANPKDDLYKLIMYIACEFDDKFRAAFKMRQRWDKETE